MVFLVIKHKYVLQLLKNGTPFDIVISKNFPPGQEMGPPNQQEWW